jgi:hypothetical protein
MLSLRGLKNCTTSKREGAGAVPATAVYLARNIRRPSSRGALITTLT